MWTFCQGRLQENKLNRARRIAAGKKDTYKYIRKFFESFDGMEVINKDWNIYTEEVNNFFEECTSAEQFRAVVQNLTNIIRKMKLNMNSFLCIICTDISLIQYMIIICF